MTESNQVVFTSNAIDLSKVYLIKALRPFKEVKYMPMCAYSISKQLIQFDGTESTLKLNDQVLVTGINWTKEQKECINSLEDIISETVQIASNVYKKKIRNAVLSIKDEASLKQIWKGFMVKEQGKYSVSDLLGKLFETYFIYVHIVRGKMPDANGTFECSRVWDSINSLLYAIVDLINTRKAAKMIVLNATCKSAGSTS